MNWTWETTSHIADMIIIGWHISMFILIIMKLYHSNKTTEEV